jgi:hypothetical protein
MGSRINAKTFFNGPLGGTPLEAGASANRWETALQAIDNAVDDLQDSVTSLQAGSVLAYRRGQTADAGPPTADGPLFYNQETSELWIPAGTGWFKTALTAVSGVSGGSNAPTNFSAVVNSDNTVSLAWTLPTPPGGTTITAVTVREKFVSPGGVSGMPLAGSATSNTRPASSSASTREYYVTVTFSSGVESAESNHVTVSLPFGTTPTGGGGSTGGTGTGIPATILNIGTGATQNHFNVGIGYAGSTHRDHTMAEIIAGYVEDPYFTSNAAGDAVHMQCFANSGVTSSTTIHPRCELREVLKDGTTKAAWPMGTGTHIMSGTSRVTHLPADAESSGTPKPYTCFAQIHDGAGDVIRLQVEDTAGTPAQSGGTHSVSSLRIVAHTHSPDGNAAEVKTEIQSTYSINQDINWKIEVINGTCKIYLGGVVKKTITLSGSGGYFKTGDYQQFSTASGDGQYAPSSYAVVELRNLSVTHTPALS